MFRSILIKHGLQLYTVVKKPDLLKLFEDNVRPKTSVRNLLYPIRSQLSSFKDPSTETNGDPSSISDVPLTTEEGADEMRPEPAVETRARSIDGPGEGVSPGPDLEPPAKRPRASSHPSPDGDDDMMGNESATSILGPMGPPPKRKPGRPKKNASIDVAPATGTEMEIDPVSGPCTISL